MLKKLLSIAKIIRPTLSKTFPRERLFKALEEGRERSLIWISGPAGSGKTTLVASYIETRRFNCLWYQLDEGDSDLATFFYYLGLAGKKAAPRVRRPLPLLTPEYFPGIQTFAKRYFENLFTRLKQPAVLVLDNYQQVPAASELHEVIANGLAVIPPGLQIIVISRSDPPAPYVRLQANNQTMVIDWDQLRLTPGEFAEVMQLQCTGPLPEDIVRAVYEKTQGWAAGVVLLCQAVRMEAADAESIRNLKPEKVFDYFSSELFARADSSVRDFLLKTAFLPNFSVKIAGDVSGHANAGQILSGLNRRNFFTEKRTQPELTYRYHPLFREFLLSCAGKAFSTETIRALRQKAAQLLEASGQVDDAAELYRESRDWQDMARLILQNAHSLAIQGRLETLERWILALPEEMYKAAPWLLYWRGICRLAPDPSGARLHFTEAYALFKRLRDRTGLLLSWTGVVDTYLYEWTAGAPLKRWIRELKRLMKDGSFPSPDIEIAVTVRMFNAMFFVQPQDRDMPAWEQKMLAYLEHIEDPGQRMMLSAHLLFYYSWTGEVDKMGKQIRDFDARKAVQTASPMTRILWLAQVAVYSWFRAKHEESLRLVQEALELSERSGMHVADTRVIAQGVFASLTAGDSKTAGSYLEKMKAILSLSPKQTMDTAQYHYISTYYFVVSGDLVRAREHAVKAALMFGKAETPFGAALGSASLAQVHILRKEFREAAVWIERARTAGRLMRSVNVEMQVHLLRAQISNARGDEQRLVRHLRKGLAIGREQGLMGIAWWLPVVIQSLCMKAIEYGIETEYIRDLIRKRDFVPETPAYHLENWPWPVKIYTLGRFSILENGKPLVFSAKGQKKPLDMLKAVIALGGRDVGDQQITDALWPEAEGDAGRMLFKTTLYRLRLLMGNSKAIVIQEGRLTLDNRLCWVDAWVFERFLGDADRLWAGGKRSKGAGLKKDQTAEAVRLTEKALDLYQCPFLEADAHESWMVSQREHLTMRYVSAVAGLAAHWEQAGEYEKAINRYQSALRVDDLTEEFYQRLMVCYHRLGRKTEAIKTYRRCCAVLKANMGVDPSDKTTAIYRKIAH